MRGGRAIRAAAWGAVAVGVAAPALRRRFRLPPPAVLGAAFTAPAALCVVVPRSRRRDIAVCVLQMWAYVAGYEIPNDDPERLRERVHVDYPVRVDRVLGLGHPPTVRLQQLFANPERFSRFEKALVWSHWLWFFVPHTSVLYVLLRRREQFPRAAVSMYAVFDLGLVAYWTVPTAPPWYAAAEGRMEDGDTRAVRRMMIEYGEQFWADNWGPLYSSLAGNPLAAMPSLHFATSVMAAHVLTDAGPVPGALGWTYATLLGIALVYLGEHYLVDLLAGLALTETVRRRGPALAPALRRISRGVQMLETRAST